MPLDLNRILRVYQLDGIEWITGQWASGSDCDIPKALLLCDEMGLGKTLQALEAANRLDIRNIIIVCPAVARRVWRDEIRHWFPTWGCSVLVVEPGIKLEDVKRRLREGGRESRLIVIVGYDLFSAGNGIADLLAMQRWQLLVLDECHYLKTTTSKRTRAIYGRHGSASGLQASAEKVLLLSGTPAPNHAAELFPHIRCFWPAVAPSPGNLPAFEEVYTRYEDTQWGRQIKGSRNVDLLREKLAPYMKRRRKRDVLLELPPLITQDAALDDKDLKLTPEMLRLAEQLRDAGDEAVLAALRVSDATLAGARHQLGLLKVRASVAWITERLTQARKMLVFGWHRDVIAALARGLHEYNPVVITGETTPANRASAIHRFQHDDGVRVFCGQIQAAGTAVTLTAASEVAMVECSWVPGDNSQAIARAHRMGQRDSVFASFLMLDSTLDSIVMKVFRRKAIEIAELVGDS